MQTLTDKRASRAEFKDHFVEFLGAFALTFVSCWAVISHDVEAGYQAVPAFAAGLIVFVFLWMGSPDKFNTMNPALTLALLIMNRQRWSVGISFLILQFAGAIVAAGFVFIQLADEQAKIISHGSVLGIPTAGSANYDTSVLMGEILASFFLGYVYVATFLSKKEGADHAKGAAAVGITVFLLLLCLAEPFGVGLNPARSLAPAIMSGRITNAQMGHLLGPIVGCLLGTVVQSSVFSEDEEELNEGLEDNVEKKQILEHATRSEGEVEMHEQKRPANGE